MKQHESEDYNLPKVNFNENLETISNNFFRPLFPVDKFEIRTETARDKGIDFHIELKKEQSSGVSVYTNFRFAVQLKATETIESNTDGSFSVQIDSSNINYLLNNGMPAFYVFYHRSAQSFYFDNVNNFAAELQQKNPNWSKQKKHSLRFSKPLDNNGIESIYKITFEFGTLLRRLNQHLKVSTARPQSEVVVINSDNEIYSVAENIKLIEQYGNYLINTSQFNVIIEIEQRSYPRTETTPWFNLYCGIAYMQRGNLYKAIEFLKLAQQKSELFDTDTQITLAYTMLNGKFLLGIISNADFEEEMQKINADENSGTFFKVEKAFDELSSNRLPAVKGMAIFYSTIKTILKDEKILPIRVIAYSKVLAAEVTILYHDLTSNFAYFIGRVEEPFTAPIYLEWVEREAELLKRIDFLSQYALKIQYYIGVNNLMCFRIKCNYLRIFHLHYLGNWKKRSFDLSADLDENLKTSLIRNCEELENIASTYKMLEYSENMLSCLLLKYEILHFLGRKDEAASMKTKMLDIVSSNEFTGLKQKYESVGKDLTSHERFVQEFTSHINKIQDFAKRNGIDPYLTFSQDQLASIVPDWSVKRYLNLELPEIIDEVHRKAGTM